MIIVGDISVKYCSLDGKVKKVNVDIVCDGGLSWVKVVARNPKAVHLNSQVLYQACKNPGIRE